MVVFFLPAIFSPSLQVKKGLSHTNLNSWSISNTAAGGKQASKHTRVVSVIILLCCHTMEGWSSGMQRREGGLLVSSCFSAPFWKSILTEPPALTMCGPCGCGAIEWPYMATLYVPAVADATMSSHGNSPTADGENTSSTATSIPRSSGAGSALTLDSTSKFLVSEIVQVKSAPAPCRKDVKRKVCACDEPKGVLKCRSGFSMPASSATHLRRRYFRNHA